MEAVMTDTRGEQQALAAARCVFIPRHADPAVLHETLAALTAAGLEHIEITFDAPGAAATIASLRQQFPATVVGAGTIKTAEQVRQAVGAGAQFVVSPRGSAALAEEARRGSPASRAPSPRPR